MKKVRILDDYEGILAWLRIHHGKEGLIIVTNSFLYDDIVQELKDTDFSTRTGMSGWFAPGGSRLGMRVIHNMAEAEQLAGIQVDALDIHKMHNDQVISYLQDTLLRQAKDGSVYLNQPQQTDIPEVKNLTDMALQQKFRIIKHEDLKKYLTEARYSLIKDLCHKITLAKLAEGKTPHNYVVVGLDEPYVAQVIKLVLSNQPKKEE